MNRTFEIMEAIEGLRQAREIKQEEEKLAAAFLFAIGWGVLRYFGVPIAVAPAKACSRDRDFASIPRHVWELAGEEIGKQAFAFFHRHRKGLTEDSVVRSDFRALVLGLKEMYDMGLSNNTIALRALLELEISTPEVDEQFQVPKLGLA